MTIFYCICIFQSNANRSLHFPFLPGHLNWSSLEAKIKKSIQRPTVSLSILCHVIQHLIPTSLFLNFYIYSLWLIHKVRDQIRQVWMQVVIIDNRQIKNSRIANLNPLLAQMPPLPHPIGSNRFCVFVAQPFSPMLWVASNQRRRVIPLLLPNSPKPQPPAVDCPN